MKTFFAGVGLFVFFFALFSAASHAACRDYDDVLRDFGEKFSEAPVMRALEARGSALVLLQNQDGSTWSLFVVSPAGEACIAGSGTDLEIFDWVDPKPEVLPQSF